MSLFQRFNKQTDKVSYPWSQKKCSGPAFPRYGHSVQPNGTGDSFIIIGGIGKSSGKKDVFTFDPITGATSNYSVSGDVPSGRSHHSAVSFANQIMIYGGEPKTVEDPIDDGLYILNLANKQWSNIRMEGRLPRGRTGHSAILHGMNMYIWGGESDGVYFQELLHFDLTALNTAPRWRALQSQNEGPCARAHHVSAVCNNKLYIFSGTDGRNVHNDIWSFDLNTGYWEQIAALGYIPSAREGASSAVVDEVLYIFGGRAADGQLLGDLCAFKFSNKRWYMFQNMGPSPTPRAGHTMTAVKDKVLVLGGEPANGIKSEDASMIYILDTSKIKYPGDAAAGAPSSPTTARAPELAMTNGSSPSPTRGLQSETPSPTTGYHSSSLAQQRQSTMPPRSESPVIHSPIEARPPPGGRGNQLSPHPNNQLPPQNQQARPLRHASMIPEAVLRRNRPTSPMPFVDSEPKRENSLNHAGGEQHHGEMSSGRAEHERRLERSDSDTLNNDDLYEGMSMNSALDPTISSNHNGSAQLPSSPGIQRPPSRAANGAGGNQPPPPRPSREGVDIGNNYRNTIAIPQGDLQLGQNSSLAPLSPKDRRPKSQVPAPDQMRDLHSISPIPSPRTPVPMAPDNMRSESPLANRNPAEAQIKSNTAKSQVLKEEQTQAYSEERANFVRELKARDAVIAEMKKKEQWWRTEVSLARKSRAKEEDITEDSDETFMTFDSPDSEKTKMFEHLVKLKAELRKVRSSIGQQSNGSCQRVVQAERMRTAALQEAAYFKSKYTAIQSKQSEELAQIETARAKELEDRLVHALSENDIVQKKLQQIQKKLNHEQQARQLAEDRAVEANAMANDTQEAHSRAVEELSNLHTRTLQAEAQVRNSAARIADLTSQLDKALTTEVSSTALSDATIKISQLEASSIKIRSELATMKQKLAESEDENERLRNSLMEKESSLIETTRILEDNEIKIGMMKDAMVKKGFEIDNDPSQSVRSEAAARLLELQQELTELKKVSKKSIQELKDEVSIYEARHSQLQSSERQAAEKARMAADDVARLQRDLRAMESSKTANDNAELIRTKAVLADLESALSEARKSESEARLSLQETSQTYQSKIQHLEREYQIATEMAKASEQTLEQVKKEAASTETKLQQLTSTLEDLQDTNQKLTVQVKAVQDSHGSRQSENQSKFIQAQVQWEAEKGLLDSKINELHSNLEALQQSSNGRSIKASEITQQLESVQIERDQLISEYAKLKNKHSEHKKESRRQARELNLEIQQLTKQIDQTTSELEAMTMTNAHLKKELDIALQNQRSDESEKWTEEKNKLVKQLDEQAQSMSALKSERDLLKKQYQDSQRKIELLLDQMNESDDEVVGKSHEKSVAKDDDTEYSAIDESSDEELHKSSSLKYIPELSNGNREPNMMQSIKSELNSLNKWTNGAYDSDDSDSDEEVVRSVQSPATLRKLEHTPAAPSRSPARSQARSPGRSPMRTPVQNHDTLDSSDEEGYDSMIHSLEAVSMKAQSITGSN